jgi:cytochrome c oxidase assembly protein subunit 15
VRAVRPRSLAEQGDPPSPRPRRRLVDRIRGFRISAEAYQRVTAVALGLLVLIVVTGAAVRLTGSGLGCTDWPTCQNNRVVAPLQYHAWMEFGNRLVTGLVAIAVVLAVLGSLVREKRRRDLTLLSLGMVVGVIGQIVLGGLVVLFDLWPPLVMGHFVVSQLLVLDVVLLHLRAGRPDGAPLRSVVTPEVRRVGRLLVALAAIAILSGTVVTGTGPHSGSNGNDLVKRLPFNISDVARLHGTIDMTFLAVTLWFVWLVHRTKAPAKVVRLTETLLVVGVLQAAVGYTQYFTGVPPLLVGLHVFGAMVLWVAVLWLFLGLSEPVQSPRQSDHARDHDDRARGGARADLVAHR